MGEPWYWGGESSWMGSVGSAMGTAGFGVGEWLGLGLGSNWVWGWQWEQLNLVKLTLVSAPLSGAGSRQRGGRNEVIKAERKIH